MTLLFDAVNEKKFDTRVLERNVTRGVVTAEAADKISRDLPDDAANAEYVNVEELADDGDNG